MEPASQQEVTGDVSWPGRLLRGYLAAVALLGPLKLGSVIGGGDEGYFPLGFAEWMFGTWPPFLFSGFAGVGLLGALLVYPRSPLQGGSRWVIGVWGGLLCSLVPGLFRTGEWDYASLFLFYVIGLLAFVLAVQRARGHDSRVDGWLLAAIAAGSLWCCLSGWRQHFGGLEATRTYIVEQAAREGRVLSETMRQKLSQTRVFGSFVYPNSYAAHLVLSGALMLLGLWRFAGHFEPVRVSRAVFAGVGGVLFAGALVFSGSRGAIVGLQCGVALGILSFSALRRWRWPVVAAVALAGVAVLYWLTRERSLLSASARLHYYSTAWRIFLEHPLIGTGLGEYFNSYLRLKPVGAEEARVAHNMVLALLSQCGLAAGLAAVACLALPALFGLGWLPGARRDDGMLLRCALVGAVAWGAHALVDFNLQIPGTVALVPVLSLLCTEPGGGTSRAAAVAGGWRARLGRLLPVLLGVLALGGLWRLPGERQFQVFSDAAGRLEPRRSRDQASRTAALLPSSPLPWLLFGRFAEAGGSPHLALEGFARAAARSPRRSLIYTHMARNRLLLGDLAGAEEAALQAVVLYPGSGPALFQLALARAVAELAESGAGGRRELLQRARFLRVYTELGEDGAVLVVVAPLRDEGRGGLPGLESIVAQLNAVGLVYHGYGGPLPVRFAAYAETAGGS